MTVPRHEIFAADDVGIYHCISRCVRRAFLCGFDLKSGVSYEHRRSWVKGRLAFLVDVFAIELISYAVMLNHLHTLLRNRPDVAAEWSPEEVAQRWRKLFPLKRKSGKNIQAREEEIQMIASDPALVEKYRKRLSSISWFNRCLCESIARRANREDECTGRFWEGRFKSQRVLHPSGVIACSAYIDLNPIRAGSARTLEESDYTSIQDRIRALHHALPSNSPKLVAIEDATNGELTLQEYLSLVDATGREVRPGKGRISDEHAHILQRLHINPKRWFDTTYNYRDRFRRIVGPVLYILKVAQLSGRHWFQGMTSAKLAFI